MEVFLDDGKQISIEVGDLIEKDGQLYLVTFDGSLTHGEVWKYKIINVDDFNIVSAYSNLEGINDDYKLIRKHKQLELMDK